jgi:hypothetical protein
VKIGRLRPFASRESPLGTIRAVPIWPLHLEFTQVYELTKVSIQVLDNRRSLVVSGIDGDDTHDMIVLPGPELCLRWRMLSACSTAEFETATLWTKRTGIQTSQIHPLYADTTEKRFRLRKFIHW